MQALEIINKGLTIRIVNHFKPNAIVQFTADQYDDFDASIFDESMQLTSILETKARLKASTDFIDAAMLIDKGKVERLQYWSKRLQVPAFVTQFYLVDRISCTYKLTNSSGALVRELELLKCKAAHSFGATHKVEKEFYLLFFEFSVKWRF